MRFLVKSVSKHPMPPEMALPLFEATSAWIKENKAGGKMEQAWSYAGLQGGGGILNVNSLEELDSIMIAFPLAPFSETEVIPLVEIDESIGKVREAIRRMMPPTS